MTQTPREPALPYPHQNSPDPLTKPGNELDMPTSSRHSCETAAGGVIDILSAIFEIQICETKGPEKIKPQMANHK
jgi:hypothetical protein